MFCKALLKGGGYFSSAGFFIKALFKTVVSSTGTPIVQYFHLLLSFAQIGIVVIDGVRLGFCILEFQPFFSKNVLPGG